MSSEFNERRKFVSVQRWGNLQVALEKRFEMSSAGILWVGGSKCTKQVKWGKKPSVFGSQTFFSGIWRWKCCIAGGWAFFFFLFLLLSMPREKKRSYCCEWHRWQSSEEGLRWPELCAQILSGSRVRAESSAAKGGVPGEDLVRFGSESGTAGRIFMAL